MGLETEFSPQNHVANRIHMYRTRQHMTINMLAEMLHISPSTLSKYENAKLSITVSTLFEIADALNVSVMQLVDYPQKTDRMKTPSDGCTFFKRANLFYMYQYFAPERKIYLAIMEMIKDPNMENDTVILYYGVEDPRHYTNAEYIYRGNIYCHDLVANIYCRNPYNESDNVSICAKSTFSMKGTTTGLLSALSQSLRNPYSTKVIFSLAPLPQNEELKNKLTINDKTVLADLRRINALIVY